MNYFQINQKQKIYELVTVTKALSLAFCAIAFFSHLTVDDGKFLDQWNIILFFILALALLYQLWICPTRKIHIQGTISLKDIGDIISALFISTIIVLYSGGAYSQYKAIFLFFILTTTMEFGMKWGLFISFLSSLSIGIIDIMALPLDDPNPYFQSDLVLMGVFFLSSWLVGYYRDTLSDSEERYQSLIRLIPDMLLVCDEEGNVFFANPPAYKLVVEASPEEFTLNHPISLGKLHPDYREFFLDKIKSAKNAENSASFTECSFVQNGGSIVNQEFALITFPYRGKSMILTILRDITERKKIEELREYDKLRNEFFANISHELRTPLNVILGTQQVLEIYLRNQNLTANKDKISRQQKILKQNCYRLLRLVNNLIDITKIDTGFFTIHPQNSNIINIVEDITLSVAEYIENKGISLVFDTDIEEKIIACDPDKIERMILNLLSNALKFTDPGGEIAVRIHDLGERVLIRVKDTGIGIPEDKQEEIFQRFRQVDRSLSRNHEGSGIGLSLVKSLVQMHGGEIYLKSEYGKGSEFSIDLPAMLLPVENQNSVHETQRGYQDEYVERIHIEFSDIYA